MVRIDEVEAAIWSQARHLAAADPLVRSTAMEVIIAAIRLYAEEMAGPIVARRRHDLRDELAGLAGQEGGQGART